MSMLFALIAATTAALLKDRYDKDQADQAFREVVKQAALDKDWNSVKYLREHQGHLTAELWDLLKKPKGTLWERFSPKGLPPGAAALEGWTAWHDARLMLTRAAELMDDPELGGIWHEANGHGDVSLEEQAEQAQWLADLLDVPFELGDNPLAGPASWPAWRRRLKIANLVLQVALSSGDGMGDLWAPAASSALDYGPSYPEHDLGRMPQWLAVAVLADLLQKDHPGLRLVPLTRDQVDAFIRAHHSALGHEGRGGGVPDRSLYAIGAAWGERVVAVATAGHPGGPWKRPPQRNVLELSRIASDGTVPNASSMLAARLLDLAPLSRRGSPGQPWLFVTYSLLSESGATYEALADKGLRPTQVEPGKKASHGGASQRLGRRLDSETRRSLGRDDQVRMSLPSTAKLRWEAGPAARPPRWDLLEALRAGMPEAQLIELSRAGG
jgi:hypothetical protein